MVWTFFLVMVLAYAQSIASTMSSRSKNRDSMKYNAYCAAFSNAIWFLTMQQLVVSNLSLYLLLPYVAGTVAGSVTGAKVSMWIEIKIGAKT